MRRPRWERRIAVGAICAGTLPVVLTACAAPAAGGGTHLPDSPFTRALQFGGIRIEPPALDQAPLVPVTRARFLAEHPASWPGRLGAAQLVAFGYGRVSAPTGSLPGQPPVGDGRLDWVAVYRASAAHLVFDGCLDGPGGRPGYHWVAAAPEPDPFYAAVLVDAITGVQATSAPVFRDICPQLRPNGPATGTSKNSELRR